MEIQKLVTPKLPQKVLKYSFVHISLLKDDPCPTLTDGAPFSDRKFWALTSDRNDLVGPASFCENEGFRSDMI